MEGKTFVAFVQTERSQFPFAEHRLNDEVEPFKCFFRVELHSIPRAEPYYTYIVLSPVRTAELSQSGLLCRVPRRSAFSVWDEKENKPLWKMVTI